MANVIRHLRLLIKHIEGLHQEVIETRKMINDARIEEQVEKCLEKRVARLDKLIPEAMRVCAAMVESGVMTREQLNKATAGRDGDVLCS